MFQPDPVILHAIIAVMKDNKVFCHVPHKQSRILYFLKHSGEISISCLGLKVPGV